jgi:hypothetical protein
VKEKMKALDLLLADRENKQGKYKIEVRFARSRSTWKPTPGIVSWWESGKKFHGGGDDKVYLCPGKRMERNDCQAPISEAGIAMGYLVCSSCGTRWKGEEGIGELAYNLPMQKWAQVLYSQYLLFGQDADIVLKHADTDIRSIAAQQESFHRGEKMDKARAKRAIHIYPLRNIIVDTSNGADLLGRIYKFLTA